MIARVRPLSRAELGQGEDKVLSVSGCSLALHVAGQAAPLRSGTHSQTKNFKLDCVFDESSTQEEVFFYIEPLLQGFIEGYNTTIFTYGQSGTGKTYSMLGYDLWEIAEDSNSTNSRYSRSQQYSDDLELATARANMGIIPRSMEWLFLKATGLRGRGLEVRISVSYLEIYNEKLIDLLSSSEPCSSPVKGGFMSPNAPVKQSLDIREINKDITVSGLTLIEVQSAAEVMEILWIGARTRSIAATDLNEYSSRSHTVFQAYLELVDTEAMEVIRSKISLVDLAGSEKLKVHQITTFSQERIKELTYINRSLSSLSNCISALLQKSKVHVPYRDSKLTRLLQDSLGGNTRSAFIVTLSPSATCLEETISSLQFADRAMRVSIETRLNRSPLQCSPSKSGSNPTFVSNSAELISCKTEIVELKKMVEFLLTKCGDSTSAVDSTTLGDGEEFEVDDDLTEDTHLRDHETADQIQNQICERRRSQSSSSQVEVSSTRQLPPQSPLRNLKERIEASSRQVSGTSSDAPLRGLGPVDLLDTSSSLLYPSSTSASTTLPSSSTTSLPHSASLSPVISITASTIVRQTSPNRRPSIRQLNGSRSSDSNTPGEDRSREAYIRRGNNIEGQQSDGRKIVREHSRSLWASEGLSEGRRSADRTEYSDDKEMTRESVRAGNESVGDDRVREDMGGVALKAERSNRQEGESQWRRKYHSWLSSTRNAQSTNANSSGQRGSSGQMDSPYRRIGGRSRRGPLSPSASSSSSNSNILLSYGTDGGGGGNGGGPVGGQESSDRSMIDRLRLMERSVIMQAEELATAKSLFLKVNTHTHKCNHTQLNHVYC